MRAIIGSPFVGKNGFLPSKEEDLFWIVQKARLPAGLSGFYNSCFTRSNPLRFVQHSCAAAVHSMVSLELQLELRVLNTFINIIQ
ncbi:hypothetical protein, partial [Pseudomonas helleri]|uniref:hypothetical protein n=1 Tax=Pseudomonas helleri TaxID=1608996 RepID=UPI003FD635DF